MNSESSNSSNTNPPGHRSLPAQAAGILAAAILLGVAYNNASPLRVRATQPGETGTPAPATAPAPRSSTVRTGYYNETISMTWEMAAPAAAAVGAPSQNPTPQKPAAPVAPVPAAAGLSIPTLKWPQVKALLDAGKIVLVDARLKVNYDLGHIPGAVLLSASSPAEALQAFAAKYPKDTALVTYCGSDACHMSRQLGEALIRIYGFTNVSNLPGGYAEYLAANPPAK